MHHADDERKYSSDELCQILDACMKECPEIFKVYVIKYIHNYLYLCCR